jgi:lantibiotic modifying enzyme
MSSDDRSLLISRRGFLGAGAAASIAAPVMIPGLLVSGVADGAAPNAEAAASAGQVPSYLGAAEEAAKWIRSAQVSKDAGIAWLPEPDHPEKQVTEGPDNTIYSGSAGTVLFFLELAQATGNAGYLEDARRGADYLAASWHTIAASDTASVLRDRGLSFDQGLAGTAFTLAEVWKATKDVKYRDAALQATRALADAASPKGDGVEWLPSPAVGLGGGIILYFIYASHTFNDRKWLQLAARGGDRILQLSQPDPRGGLKWHGLPEVTPALLKAGVPADAYFPNFELGTAGVAFVLARLYAETRQARYLEAARAGAKHIQAIATLQGDSALVFYREPDLKDLYYLGYCHGPAGTARLFYQLHQATGEAEYQEWAEKLGRGVIRSGVPEKLTPGYWNVACQCCGAAAEVDFFLSLWLATGKTEYRDFARRVADQLISRETNLDGKGYRWYQAWTRVKPWEVNAETGYKIGAAGIGAALVHTQLAVENRYAAILFPDNPFPRSQRI